MNQEVTVDGHPLNQHMRTAIQLQSYGEPKEALKILIGLCGIQKVGVSFPT